MILMTGSKGFNINEYVADTEQDVLDLQNGTRPTLECAMSSSIFVIETSKVYMKNSNQEWKAI